jgi:hypothetical protein
METVRELSLWGTGMGSTIDIVSTIEADSLRWALRDYANARFTRALPSGETPAIVITPVDTDSPELTAAYRGQDFVWWTHPAWPGALPALKDWLTFRRAPLTSEHVILWARTDLFE